MWPFLHSCCTHWRPCSGLCHTDLYSKTQSNNHLITISTVMPVFIVLRYSDVISYILFLLYNSYVFADNHFCNSQGHCHFRELKSRHCDCCFFHFNTMQFTTEKFLTFWIMQPHKKKKDYICICLQAYRNVTSCKHVKTWQKHYLGNISVWAFTPQHAEK